MLNTYIDINIYTICVFFIQIILTDRTIKTFEVSLEQFNHLRYGVAKILNDMQTLERHPIMRIVREFERKDKEERFEASK